MNDVKILTTDEEIDAAIAEANALPPEPLALSAHYNRDFDMIIIRLDSGRRLLIPREELQGLEAADESQLSRIEIFSGLNIAWPDLDVDHYLPHLLDGKYASECWKQGHKAQSAA